MVMLHMVKFSPFSIGLNFSLESHARMQRGRKYVMLTENFSFIPMGVGLYLRTWLNSAKM